MERSEIQNRAEIAKALLTASLVITGQELHKVALESMVEDLVGYGHEMVKLALSRCRKECRGRFSLADVIDRITLSDGRPGADEAWMNALLAYDEDNTVVWTEETANAFSIARPALDINDKVGARMAFKDAYERMVNDAREANIPAKWSATLGFDVEQRRQVLESAVQCGRLLPGHAVGLLPPPAYPKNRDEMVLRLACVDGEVVNDESMQREMGRRRLAELKAMLNRKKA